MRPDSITLSGREELYHDFQLKIGEEKMYFSEFAAEGKASHDDLEKLLWLNHGESEQITIDGKTIEVYRPEMTIEEYHGV